MRRARRWRRDRPEPAPAVLSFPPAYRYWRRLRKPASRTAGGNQAFGRQRHRLGDGQQGLVGQHEGQSIRHGGIGQQVEPKFGRQAIAGQFGVAGALGQVLGELAFATRQALIPAFVSRSANQPSFCAALLRTEGLTAAVADKSHLHQVAGNWTEWKAAMLALPGEPYAPPAKALAVTSTMTRQELPDDVETEVPSAFRLPKGGFHATSFCCCCSLSQSSRN